MTASLGDLMLWLWLASVIIAIVIAYGLFMSLEQIRDELREMNERQAAYSKDS
jgi:hypothetical protein